jgi:hypothetical protein
MEIIFVPQARFSRPTAAAEQADYGWSMPKATKPLQTSCTKIHFGRRDFGKRCAFFNGRKFSLTVAV